MSDMACLADEACGMISSMPDMVSVELNGKILRRTEFESTTLNDGDRVKFRYFMGGGCGTN